MVLVSSSQQIGEVAWRVKTFSKGITEILLGGDTFFSRFGGGLNIKLKIDCFFCVLIFPPSLSNSFQVVYHQEQMLSLCEIRESLEVCCKAMDAGVQCLTIHLTSIFGKDNLCIQLEDGFLGSINEVFV